MSHPYEPKINVSGIEYFPEPYSAPQLPSSLRNGLIPLGLLATLSVVSTTLLIGFIVHRFITWRLHYKTFVGYNQYVVLVLNLLIAGKSPKTELQHGHSADIPRQISSKAPPSSSAGTGTERIRSWPHLPHASRKHGFCTQETSVAASLSLPSPFTRTTPLCTDGESSTNGSPR